jgi:hypothetical protein
MRRLILVSTLLVSACATGPTPQAPVPQTPTPAPSRPERGVLLGLTAPDLVSNFGNPALQVREGNSLKIQFRNRRCVLDAYLYPPAGGLGAWRVTHVDTRDLAGRDMSQDACVAEFVQPS